MIEPSFAHGNATRKGDLLIDDRNNGIRRMIDFVISDPTTHANMQCRSFDNPLAVTSHAEKERKD